MITTVFPANSYFLKVNNKSTSTTSLLSFWCVYCQLRTYFTHFCSAFTIFLVLLAGFPANIEYIAEQVYYYLQSWTKYLKQNLYFMRNRNSVQLSFYFFRNVSSVLPTFSFWEEVWILGYNSINLNSMKYLKSLHDRSIKCPGKRQSSCYLPGTNGYYSSLLSCKKIWRVFRKKLFKA